MSEHEYSSDTGRRDAPAGGNQPDWATRAIQAKAIEWSSDRVLDQIPVLEASTSQENPRFSDSSSDRHDDLRTINCPVDIIAFA